MKVAQFNYDLPDEAIAQVPAMRREDSKLLVINRKTGEISDHLFSELPSLLSSHWHLVRNNVSVLKARLYGKRPTGGKVECLLLTPSAEDPLHSWWCLLKPAKKFQPKDTFTIQEEILCQICEKEENGRVCIRFKTPTNDSVTSIAEKYGMMPLPPYIKRESEDSRTELDKERYQTVYANQSTPTAAAAPTAGLHFSDKIIQKLESTGHQFHDLTLHVGLGTFKPIEVDDLRDHAMHSEAYEIPPSTLKTIQSEKILAIGTTSMRAIEDAYRKKAHLGNHSESFINEASLFIYPPAQFRTDALITNFHLPKSTLLCLVSAFLTPESDAGIKWLQQIYQYALRKKYRFYSYGDAMLIL